MTRHILVPLDGSEQAWKALDHACSEYAGERLTVLNVVDPTEGMYTATAGEYYTGEVYERLQEQALEAGESLCEEARERAPEGAEIETTVETGRPARTIVDYATENEVDHIVMGSHGRSGATRILFGSVAESVTRRAPVPVTIVR